MNHIILREIFSESVKNKDVPYGTLFIVLALVALVIFLIYMFRHRLDEFLRISDAETFVNKKGSKKGNGTSTGRTQSMRVLNDDPEKTTNMKTIDLPRKSSKKGE